jgi:hypothetical protein
MRTQSFVYVIPSQPHTCSVGFEHCDPLGTVRHKPCAPPATYSQASDWPEQVLELLEQAAPKYSQYSPEAQVLPKEPPQVWDWSTQSA